MNSARARDPKADHATLTAIQTAAQRGAHAEAAAMASAALNDGLEHPLVFNVAALALELQGRVSEAAPSVEASPLTIPPPVP